MYNTHYLNLDIDSDTFDDDFDVGLLANHFDFVLKWTTGKKVILLDCILRENGNEFDMINQPILGSNGTIALPLGPHANANFRLSFRVYAAEAVPKIKAFLIDKTAQVKVRTNPTNTPKTLKKKDLWSARL